MQWVGIKRCNEIEKGSIQKRSQWKRFKGTQNQFMGQK